MSSMACVFILSEQSSAKKHFITLGKGGGGAWGRGGHGIVLIIMALDTKHEFLRHRAGASCIQFDHGALKLSSTLTILISTSVHICRSVRFTDSYLSVGGGGGEGGCVHVCMWVGGGGSHKVSGRALMAVTLWSCTVAFWDVSIQAYIWTLTL